MSHDHITGPSVQLAEVIFFFKLCTHQLLIFIDRRLNYFWCLISIVLKRPYDKKLLNLIHSVITGNSQTPAYPYSWLISGMLFLTLRYKRIMSPISFFDELFLTCFTIFFLRCTIKESPLLCSQSHPWRKVLPITKLAGFSFGLLFTNGTVSYLKRSMIALCIHS